MEEVSKIVFEVVTTTGDTTKVTVNYADADATVTAVKAAATAIVTNGDIFDPAFVSVKGAYLTTTSKGEYNLN